MTDFIDDFLNNLESDKPKPKGDFSRLNKVLMAAGPNQGTIVFAPFMDPKTSKFYRVLTGVREFKTYSKFFHDGEDDVWVKILPEEAYGELTEEEHNLYEEVAGKFDQYKEIMDETSDSPWSFTRQRSYSLFQGIILNHVNSEGAEVTDNIGTAALIMFPTKSPITKLSDAIAAKAASMKNVNPKTWLIKVLCPTDSGRSGAVSIKFNKKSEGVGYDANVSFEFNSEWSQIIDPEMKLEEDTLKLFTDFVSSFIGWENGENGKLFNKELFMEMNQSLTVELKKLDAIEHAESEEKPENKNGQDPMLAETHEEKEVKVETQAETTQAPQPSQKPVGDFPF